MLHAVVADNVPLIDHSLHKLLVPLGIITCEEEHRLDIFLFQSVKYRRCEAVFIALIECQAYLVAVGNGICTVAAELFIEHQRTNGAVVFIYLTTLTVSAKGIVRLLSRNSTAWQKHHHRSHKGCCRQTYLQYAYLLSGRISIIITHKRLIEVFPQEGTDNLGAFCFYKIIIPSLT